MSGPERMGRLVKAAMLVTLGLAAAAVGLTLALVFIPYRSAERRLEGSITLDHDVVFELHEPFEAVGTSTRLCIEVPRAPGGFSPVDRMPLEIRATVTWTTGETETWASRGGFGEGCIHAPVGAKRRKGERIARIALHVSPPFIAEAVTLRSYTPP